MRKSNPEFTTANLESKFDTGEEVLDYFDMSKAKTVSPEPDFSTLLGPWKSNASRKALVRERPPGYRNKEKK